MKSSFDMVLEGLEKKSDFLKYLPFAISALKASGVFEALHELARPATVPATNENCVAAQAFEAQRSIGYNAALDDILYFKERYLKTKQSTDTPVLNYGANVAAVESGDLTKEELDAIISGADPNDIYAKLYAEHTRAAAGA